MAKRRIAPVDIADDPLAYGEAPQRPQHKPKKREDEAALYVRVPRSLARELSRVSVELDEQKRDVVAALLWRYADSSKVDELGELIAEYRAR